MPGDLAVGAPGRDHPQNLRFARGQPRSGRTLGCGDIQSGMRLRHRGGQRQRLARLPAPIEGCRSRRSRASASTRSAWTWWARKRTPIISPIFQAAPRSRLARPRADRGRSRSPRYRPPFRRSRAHCRSKATSRASLHTDARRIARLRERKPRRPLFRAPARCPTHNRRFTSEQLPRRRAQSPSRNRPEAARCRPDWRSAAPSSGHAAHPDRFLGHQRPRRFVMARGAP